MRPRDWLVWANAYESAIHRARWSGRRQRVRQVAARTPQGRVLAKWRVEEVDA